MFQPQPASQVPAWVNVPPPPAVSGSPGVSFGGSLDCGSIERDGDEDNMPWKVIMRNSRGKHDMRPVKVVPRFSKQCCHQGSSCHCVGSICSLDRDACQGNICGVEQFAGQWERVPVTVDSGAVDSVIPKRVASGVPIRETAASRSGLKYRAANGTSIANEGERVLRGYTKEANMVDMAMQVAEVTKPLGSVRAMVKAGNRVVFDEQGSYIQNKFTGLVTQVEERNGAYVFDIWVPRNKNKQESGYNGKLWGALVEEEQEENMGFVGLDDLM